MATNNAPSAKHALIDKANTRIVAYVSIAAFLLVFSLVATKTLVSQAAYQNRVLNKKHVAVKQLKDDIAATSGLKSSYTAFVNQTQNVLGGSSTGTGPQDGNNASIVLDALPSSYDFPGLTTSLENLLTAQPGIAIDSIAGTDDEVAQGSNQLSPTPTPTAIPFTISVSGDYPSLQGVIGLFERSIRPIQVQTMSISGRDSSLTMTITAQTYYQPAKQLNINKTTVK